MLTERQEPTITPYHFLNSNAPTGKVQVATIDNTGKSDSL